MAFAIGTDDVLEFLFGAQVHSSWVLAKPAIGPGQQAGILNAFPIAAYRHVLQ